MDEVLQANLVSIKGSLQCSEVAERSGETDLTEHSEYYRGRCPLPQHHGSSPSFYVYKENGWGAKWRCHRCDEGGDVIDLHDALYGPFPTIYVTLSDMAARWGVKLWEEEDVMSGEALVRKRARAVAEERIKRVLTFRLFRKSVMPLIMEIEDPRERARELAESLRIAGLA